MHRFYIPSPAIQKETLTIRDLRLLHQLTRVLRMHPASKFSVFNEKGEEVAVQILEINRQQIICQILEKIKRDTEPQLVISLYQAIPKKPALFEWVVEKATELGVSEIYPLITERTEKRRLSKFERLQKIAIESAEQCGRLKVPTIHHPIAFEAALRQAKNAYLAYEFQEGLDLLDYGKSLAEGNQICIFIGPEGGFSQKEVELAKKAGVRPFTLGPRILRTETAAMACLSLLLHLRH